MRYRSASLTRGSSFAIISFSSGPDVERLLERHLELAGIILAIRSTSAYGIPSTRPTSRTTARAAMVPKVMIWQTLSLPYLSMTYWMTSSRPAVGEIDVDIRHRNPLRIQEPLEQEIEPDRVDIGDAEAVRHERPGRRTAPRSDRDLLRAGVVEEIFDDQEIPGVPHLLDDAQFVIEPLLQILGRDFRVAPVATLPRQMPRGSRRRRRISSGIGKTGSLSLPSSSSRLQISAIAERVFERLGVVAEQLLHLLGRLEINLVGVVAHPVGVGRRSCRSGCTSSASCASACFCSR